MSVLNQGILNSARTGSVLSENDNNSPSIHGPCPSIQEQPISLNMKDLNNEFGEHDKNMFPSLNNHHNTTDEESMM